MNKIQQYNCTSCSDNRGWEIYDHSTDAVIGWVDCKTCPPIPLFWKIRPFWESEWKLSPEELATLPPF